MTTPDDKIDTIACQLRLLFAGLTDDEIAKSISAAVGPDDGCGIFWLLRYELPIGMPYGMDSATLHAEMKHSLGEGEELVASTRDLDFYMAYFDNIDVGDQGSDTTDEIMDKLRTTGLIRSQAVTSEGDVK